MTLCSSRIEHPSGTSLRLSHQISSPACVWSGFLGRQTGYNTTYICYKEDTYVHRMAEGFPYVGSLMSLVTHNAARYEGVLSMVDMPNSSITLSGGMFAVLILVFSYRRVSGHSAWSS